MLSLSGLPVFITDLIADLEIGENGFLALYFFILILVGCFIDSVSILLVVVPIVLPVVRNLSMDPIWFGVVIVVAVEIGLLTSPFGLSAFAVKASLDDPTIPLGAIFRGSLPFVGAMIVLIVLLAIFPSIALVLTQ